MSQNDVRKSNDYYMNTGIQKTEIQKTKKSPFGVLSFILFLTGILVSIFVPMGIYIGLGINLLSLIFAIIHIVLKKKGFVWLIFSILGCFMSIGLIVIPFVKPDIYEISNKSLFIQLTVKEEPEVKKEPQKPVETKKKEEFEKEKDYITNSNWQMINDKSCFYFLDSGSYYWCKDKDNFDDNYYYGQYTVYKGEKAIEKLNELKENNEIITDEFMNYLVENKSDNSKNTNNKENTIETESITEDNIEINLGEETETLEENTNEMSSISESESEIETSEKETVLETEMINKESISQIYFIEMTNDLCYMDGKDISIDYKKTKPIRYYCIIVDSLNKARGCDIEKFEEEGFIEMIKLKSNNLSNITKTEEESKLNSNNETNTQETIEETEIENNLESQKNTNSKTTVNKSSFTNPVGLDKE